MALAVVSAALTVDLRRPPREQVSALLLLTAIDFYQEALPVPETPRCRMVPTCSRYAEEAVGRFGAWTGGGLMLRRIARCGPWTAIGTEDHVPVRAHVGE